MSLILIAFVYSDKIYHSFSYYYSGELFSKAVVEYIIASIYLFFVLVCLCYLVFSLFKKKKIIFISIIITLFLIFLLVISTAIYSASINYSELPKDKNGAMGIVLGAAVWSINKPSPTLAARVDKAIELAKKGFIDELYFTGGKAPGEITEAEAAYNYYNKKKLSNLKIHMEKKSSSTIQQILFIKNSLLKKRKNIIIISDYYHLARVREICKFYNIKASYVSSDFNLNIFSRLYYAFRESVALAYFWLFGL